MKASHRGNPESRFDRFALWLGLAIATWLASMCLTQLFYWLVPARPSEAALRLQEEAARRPAWTENGFRLAGLLAPAGRDPVAFGRCLYPDAEKQAEMPTPDPNHRPSSREEVEARRFECLKGQPALALSPNITNAIAAPLWTLQDWVALGEQSPNPELLERAQKIWAEGPSILGWDFWSPTPDRRALSKLSQWRVAQGVRLWQSDSHDAALQSWRNTGQHALLATEGPFFETKLSVDALSQMLLGMQMAAQSSAQADEAQARELLKITAQADQMPDRALAAMIAEWQMGERTFRSVHQGLTAKLPEHRTTDQAMLRATFEIFRDIAFDPVDTVNHFTAHFEQQRDRLAHLANGQAAAPVRSNAPCVWMGDWNLLCRAYQRNPAGRVLTSVAVADYAAYGTRIADLRNLAAATRLTIEARRQGLQGEALARFVAEAPENMRDIFSKSPFTYDPGQRQLTIQLREKSTVLGEGSYTLSL
jgi:hypothetical protein